MLYVIEVMINGMVVGALYALIALGFVVVYKASRVINFALGELAMVGANVVAAGVHLLHLGVALALALGFAGTILLALAFNRLVLRFVLGHPVFALIMVTIGLGAFLRAAVAVLFRGFPKGIPLPIPREPLVLHTVLLSPDELVAGAVALLCIAGVGAFFTFSRTGVALRALADDPQAAALMGIDARRAFAVTWAMAGGIAAVGGTLWSFITGGGFGLAVVGLKVFPIVIIGGLDSIAGVIVGGMAVGLLENLAAHFVDPVVGGGFSNIAAFIVLIAVLMVRPHGLLGRERIERV